VTKKEGRKEGSRERDPSALFLPSEEWTWEWITRLSNCTASSIVTSSFFLSLSFRSLVGNSKRDPITETQTNSKGEEEEERERQRDKEKGTIA